MFSLSSFEKGSSVGPQNSSPGHNNISNRFPVGIPSLGDENQQIRIQLAVHKYNSSSNSSVTNRRSLISPVRQSLLRNSPKGVRNYEGDMEPSLKSEHKSGNRYEGVGTFPTVHLKKSSVRYRPIRRFNEVKVPYPELPVSRFLNHLPELCPDVKSSTRSVLDVLQDLSRKRIHSKDEDDSAKLRSKGLGGDISMDAQAAYKPLFVKKPKVNAVMTRDNTTQTQLAQGLDGSSPHCSNVNSQSEPSDPRAELRKKLARQYNEISASLSSSVTPSFSTKRKIDKVATTARDDDQQNDSSASKKQKVVENHTNGHKQNGILKFADGPKTNSNESSLKVGRKKKLNETNTTSPNKDRLTTIFLDMQNSSPKAQVFQNNSEGKNTNNSENNVPVLNGSSNSPLSKITTNNELKNTAVDGPFELKNQSLEKSGGSLAQSPKLNFISPGLTTSTPTSNSEKSNPTELNNPTFKFPVSKTSDTSPISSGTNLSSSPSLQFNFKPPSGSNLNFGTSSFNSNSGNAALGAGLLNVQNASADNKNVGAVQSDGENKQAGVNKFTFGSSSTNGLKKPDFSTFPFGVENKSSPTQSQPSTLNSSFNAGQKTDQNMKPDALTTNTSSASSSVTTQFSFGSKPNIASTTASPAGGFQFGQVAATNSGVQNTPSSQAKPSFTFGQQKLDSSNKTDNKSDTPKTNFSPSNIVTTQNSSNTNSSSVFGQSIQSSASFTFGKKSENSQSLDTGQNVLGLNTSSGQTPSSQTSIFSQSNSIIKTNFSAGVNSTSLASTSGSTSLSQNSTTQVSSVSSGGDQPKSFGIFTFGQKPAVSETTSPSSSISGNTPAEPKSQSNFSFGFGQNKVAEAGGFGQKNQTNLFSFGSNTTAQGSEQNSAVPTNTLNQTGSNTTNSFGQNLSKPLSQPSLFGQNSSQVSDTAKTTNSAQPDKIFGQSSVPSSVGPNTTNFESKPNIFGTTTTQSVTGFGTSTTTQSNSLFGTSTATQSVSALGTSTTTTSAPAFGTTTTAQSTFVFGKTATTQANSLFGTSTAAQSTPVFGATTTTQSTPVFGATTTTQSTPVFGTSTTTQSTPTFGATTTTQSNSLFGTSTTTQSTPAFGATTTAQSTSVFGTSTTTQPTAFGTSITTQSNSVFGTSTTTQPAAVFGTSVTTQSTTTFGTLPTTQPATGFGGNAVFGASASSQVGTGFGAPKGTFGTTAPTSSTFGSSTPAFGSSTTTSQPTSGFGSSTTTFGTTNDKIQPGPAFGSSSSTQSITGFASTSAPQTSFLQTFGQNNNKTDTSLPQTGNIFGQTTVTQNPASGTGFPSTSDMNFNATAQNQNSIFGQKTNTQPANVFGQSSKTEASPFNQASTSQSLGTQNNFSFGMSTSNATGFTSSAPNTTTASVFTFGGNNTTQGTAYNFGGSTASSSSSSQTPFAFGSTPSNTPFKFGASTTKEGLGFGGSNTSTFSFGAPMNNNATSVAQPSGTTFNFGNTQTSTPAFSFGSTPSPSVFSFGSSASSTSSASTFNFGTPQPNTPFGQNATPTPGTPFSVPGTFSIGSGSSQSNQNRPRASTRLRRRP